MNEPETFPAPTLDTAEPPPRNKWEQEYRAFLQLLPQLLTTHYGQFVAIHEEKVVDSGDDQIPLALRVYAKYGYVPMHIARVVEQPQPAVRVPYYRVLHNGPA